MNTIPEQNPELSSPGGPEKPVTNEPIIKKIREMDEEELLTWIQQEKPKLLRGEDLDNFKKELINGCVFLAHAGDWKFFKEGCNLHTGPSDGLAELASKVIGKKTGGIKRHSEQAEPSGSPAKKRLLLSRLKGSSAIYETESAVTNSDLFFPSNAQFTKFFSQRGAIVVDKTHFIPLLEKNSFEYMFLRPRQWGKTTFLNMLATYYDVKTRDSFKEIFGGLHIGKAPTESRNSHLVLLFDFSQITVLGSFEDIRQSVFDTISLSLRRFLLKYRNILGDVSPEEYIISGRTGISLEYVLDLIYQKGYTAFVGVDEYDTPAKSCLMAALSDRTCLPESKRVLKWLEILLKSEFFSVMKQACGVSVAKYWLTGVLPAFRDGISPLTATEVISFDEQYQSLCGLTQEDVSAIVTRALPESEQASTLDSLKYWYNGYMFSPPWSGSGNLTLYNPQHIFVHLRKTISKTAPPSYRGEANAIHTATVLSALGENGPVTIHDLIGMLYSNASACILSELSFAELMQETRPKNVTWSLLFYLGIVTFSTDSAFEEGTHILHVPNRSMNHLISQRIRAHLNSDPNYSTTMRNSYKDFMDDNTTPLVKLLEAFFRDLPIRSFILSTELSLENTIKLLWIERQCVTQMHLLADETKQWGHGQSGFVDIFGGISPRILVIELKNVSLRDLYYPSHRNSPAASQYDYEPLMDMLSRASEDELLNLEHLSHDRTTDQRPVRQVKDTLQAATAQLNGYISIISRGQGAKAGQGKSGRSGVFDHRVLCQKGGQDVLWGYVIICVGTRVICRKTATKATEHSYGFTSSAKLMTA